MDSLPDKLPLKEQIVKRHSVSEILQINQHPTLTWLEKKYVGVISRKVSVDEHVDGSLELNDSALQKKLRSIVYYSDSKTGQEYKHSFQTVINSLSQKSPSACNLPFLPVGELIDSSKTITYANVLASAVAGNPIEQTTAHKGNCLELAITADIIGKLFYQEEAISVALLPYTRVRKDSAGNEKLSRHFMILWQEQTHNSSQSQIYITRYRPLSGKSATRNYMAENLDSIEESNQGTIHNIGENANKILAWWKSQK